MTSSFSAARPPEEVVMFSRLWKEDSEGERDVKSVENHPSQEGSGRDARIDCDIAPRQDESGLEDGPPQLAVPHDSTVDSDASERACNLQRDGDQAGADANPNFAARLNEGSGQEAESSQTADEELETDVSFDPEEGFTPDSEGEISAPRAHFVPAAGPRRRKTRLLVDPEEVARQSFNPQQRLLLLDTWQRSGLPAKDFAALVGVSKHTLYKWKRLFEERGPEGLMDQRQGSRRGSRLPEVTKRTILMLNQAHPEWGCQRISDALLRGPALSASPQAIGRVLREAGYESAWEPTRPHRARPRTFERARPNQLWQTDLFTFMLKRQNRRVYLVAFMDDHSRFIVSYGLHASASTALVIEALEAGIANHGVPEEILTDNGPQYVTWRGKSRFTKQLEKRGIRQIVAKPKRPQTLGKVERFWGTLWRELIETAVFVDLTDARARIGHFLDYYNFQRTHTGIDGLVPADRFFQAADEVRRTLAERVAANALELARQGHPKSPFYVTGQVSGQSFSVHSQGERLVLTRDGQQREEIELTEPTRDASTSAPTPICPHASGSPELEELDPAESHEPEQAPTDDDDDETSEEGATP
jgi:transposase InsO family protein